MIKHEQHDRQQRHETTAVTALMSLTGDGHDKKATVVEATTVVVVDDDNDDGKQPMLPLKKRKAPCDDGTPFHEALLSPPPRPAKQQRVAQGKENGTMAVTKEDDDYDQEEEGGTRMIASVRTNATAVRKPEPGSASLLRKEMSFPAEWPKYSSLGISLWRYAKANNDSPSGNAVMQTLNVAMQRVIRQELGSVCEIEKCLSEAFTKRMGITGWTHFQRLLQPYRRMPTTATASVVDLTQGDDSDCECANDEENDKNEKLPKEQYVDSGSRHRSGGSSSNTVVKQQRNENAHLQLGIAYGMYLARINDCRTRPTPAKLQEAAKFLTEMTPSGRAKMLRLVLDLSAADKEVAVR